MLQLMPLTNPLLLKAYNAAFSEKSLSTSEANKYSVVEAVDALVEVYANLAPRSVASVLLGTTKIYGYQVSMLQAAVQKEVHNTHKPQELFHRPKEPHAAPTTLTSATMAKSLPETPSETLLQLEPVSVEAPRLQAREEDISFEEWRDASVRSSLLSRSSDRIPKSETFLQDLGVDQGNMLEIEDVAVDVPPPDLDLSGEEKENPVEKAVLHRPDKVFLRTDPATQLTKKAVKQNLTDTSATLRMPVFEGPCITRSLTGPSELLPSSLYVLMVPSTFQTLEVRPPSPEPAVEDPLPDIPPQDDYYPEAAEMPASSRPSAPAPVQEYEPQELLSQRSQKMLLFLKEKLRSLKKLSFAALTKDQPQLRASSLLELLHLTQQGYVTLTQKADFADIVVRPTNLLVA